MQAAGFWWAADYPAASNFLDVLFSCHAFAGASPGNMNMAEFCDTAIDDDIAAAQEAQARDPGQAVGEWQAVDGELVNEAPFAALANQRGLDVLSPRVGNYQNHPQWQLLVDQLWVT